MKSVSCSFFSKLQLSLFSVLLLCTVGRTTAHISADGNVTVLVKKWEDFIQNGVSIPMLTETDLTVKPEEEIKIKTPLCCARAMLVQSSKTTLTVKNGGQPFSVHIPEGETSINLTREHPIERGKNLLVLQSDSTYTLYSDTPRPFCYGRIDNTRVFTTSVTRYIHLYVIDTPVIVHGIDNTTLVCHLNNTGSCNNLIVSFIKEENKPQNVTKNVTVGHCFRGSVQTHQRLRFYFNESSVDGIDCIMEFSSSLSPQDTGRYHCIVRILNAETKELVINGSGYEMIEVPESTEAPPTKQPYYLLPVTIGSSVGVVLVVCIVIGAVAISVYRKRAARHANRRGYDDISESSESSVYPPSSEMPNVSTTTSLSSPEDEGGQNANDPNTANGSSSGLESHPIDEPPSSMSSQPNSIPAGNQQLPAGAAKPLNPSTPSSTPLSKTKPKLQGAQAAASHNIRMVEREKARSRQHRRESRKGTEKSTLISKDTTTRT